MPKLLITGAGGQLGQELTALRGQYPEWSFYTPNRQEFDIADEQAVADYFAAVKPDYCLNTAAYTAVDRAEEEQALAFAINAKAARFLAECCAEHQTHLLHFSTDYVYQGGIARPLLEDDPTEPAGVYAASKLRGDEAVLQVLPTATVIRTSWVYSSFGHNFVKTMLRLGEERERLGIVFDQIGTPTYAKDLAQASLQLIALLEAEPDKRAELAGIFHYSNEGVCSWYDFALAIFEMTGIECDVRPIESHEYPTPAQRPHFSVLNKGKFKKHTGLEIRHWREALRECLQQLGQL